MPTVVFVQEGASIDYTPVADVAAGDVVVQGELVGIAKLDIPANTLGALAVEGVFDFPKATGVSTAIATGANVYWDAGDVEAKEDAEAGANKLIGKTILDAGDNDPLVRVRLNQ
jgi:predicted RecA/RadA family phage recombinase